MRFNTENSGSLLKTNRTKCAQYSARKKDEGRSIVECKSTCKASWQDVDRVVRKITSLGCFDNDHYRSQCSDNSCKSFHREELRSDEQKQRELDPGSNSKLHVNICCCSGEMCNSDLQPRYQPNRVATSTQNTEPSPQGAHRLDSTLADSAFPDPAMQYSPIWIVLAACGIILGIIGYVIKRAYFQDSGDSNLRVKRLGRICRDQCPTKFTGPNYIDNVQTKVEESLQCNLDCGQKNEVQIEISFRQLLGQGKFGTVYLVNTNKQQFMCFKEFCVPGVEMSYSNEIEINNILQKYSHSYLVRYFGPFNVGTRNGILTEFCSLGSLRNFVVKNTIGFDICCSFLQNLTCAVAFLHSSVDSAGHAKRSIAHRDLKSANIMVRKNLTLAVGDFGVALALDNRNDETKDVFESQHLAAEGTPFYASPEVLDLSINLKRFRISLKQADVYAMALVMWEIVNRCKDFYGSGISPPQHSLPYQHDVVTTSQLINHVVLQGKRPKFAFQHPNESSNLSPGESKVLLDHPLDGDREYTKIASSLVNTIRECWDKDEDARLTAACVEERILSIPFRNCLDQETALMESSV